MINVPISNPIRFRPLTGQTAPNFDNTFDDDYLGYQKPFSQNVLQSGWKLQVVSDTDYMSGATSDLILFVDYENGSTDSLDEPVCTELNGLYYYTFDLNLNYTGCAKIFARIFSTDTDYWESEWVHVLTEITETHNLVLEWFNHENQFGMNYVESGMVNLLNVEAKFDYWQPTGDITVFDNLGEDVKLKEVVQRVMKFETEVPSFVAEILVLAMSHDRFFINDVQYVNGKKPTIQQIGKSNVYKFEAELTQAVIVGINTHDTGFDCDGGTNPDRLTVTLTTTETDTVELPSGYQLHVVTGEYQSGTYAVTIGGTTVGDDDLWESTNFSSSETMHAWMFNIDLTSSMTVYVGFQSGDAEVEFNFELIKI